MTRTPAPSRHHGRLRSHRRVPPHRPRVPWPDGGGEAPRSCAPPHPCMPLRRGGGTRDSRSACSGGAVRWRLERRRRYSPTVGAAPAVGPRGEGAPHPRRAGRAPRHGRQHTLPPSGGLRVPRLVPAARATHPNPTNYRYSELPGIFPEVWRGFAGRGILRREPNYPEATRRAPDGEPYVFVLLTRQGIFYSWPGVGALTATHTPGGSPAPRVPTRRKGSLMGSSRYVGRHRRRSRPPWRWIPPAELVRIPLGCARLALDVWHLLRSSGDDPGPLLLLELLILGSWHFLG